MAKCIQCKTNEVTQDLERCERCNTDHKKLITELDARPKQIIQKVPEKWVYYKQVQGGVTVTVRMTEEEALLTGKRI